MSGFDSAKYVLTDQLRSWQFCLGKSLLCWVTCMHVTHLSLSSSLSPATFTPAPEILHSAPWRRLIVPERNLKQKIFQWKDKILLLCMFRRLAILPCNFHKSETWIWIIGVDAVTTHENSSLHLPGGVQLDQPGVVPAAHSCVVGPKKH